MNYVCKKRILVNLSNHPYSCWKENQKEAARKYGECIDLPFPDIKPSLDEADIELLSEQYVSKILEMREQGVVTVHVMGEFTFCYSVVRKLLMNDIVCIASCAKRDVEYMENGSIKQAIFNFERFREYAKI